MTVIATIDGLGKRYGDIEALRDVTLRIEGGEILALLGHNGAGKTTLMKLMLGLIEPSCGSIRIGGEQAAFGPGPAARRLIGFVPESVVFPRAMSGREMIAFYCRLKGEPPAAGMALLDRVGLGAAAGRRIATYSKGMCQRLGLAQALIGRPLLLLLDEPTTGLDPALRREFYAMLDELRSDGVAVVLSSHALAEIETKADRFALLGRGRLLACAGLSELLQHTATLLRVAVRVTPCTTQRVLDVLPTAVELEARAPDRLALRCPPEAKMELLRRIGRLGDIVRDIEIDGPGLETTYQALLARQSEGQQ